jgi:general secretion pathway protein G
MTTRNSRNWLSDSSCFRRESRRGFTLIEILVVIVIISVLASFVALNVVNKPSEARTSVAKLQVKELQSALQVYRTEQGRYPTQAQGLEALIRKPAQDPVPENYPEDGYLAALSLPRDPWNHAYIYLVPGRKGEPYEVICYGSDGEPGGKGEAADISSSTP